MKRLRLDLAVAGMAVSAAVCLALWPHARDAGALLAAQNDPAELSDLQLNSALRNNRAVIEQNIEAALAANDADLANSFVDLAGRKTFPFPTSCRGGWVMRLPRRIRRRILPSASPQGL